MHRAAARGLNAPEERDAWAHSSWHGILKRRNADPRDEPLGLARSRRGDCAVDGEWGIGVQCRV
jgi:hypothetical protein